MQLGMHLSSSEKFRDAIFTFQDYITKYQETFVRFNKSDQALFQEHAKAKMHIKVDPIQIEKFDVTSYEFKKIEEIPNVYASLSLANSLEENYPVSKQFFKIKCTFDGSVFKRYIIITDQEKFDQEKKDFEKRKEMFSKYKLVQSYILNYHFPRKIKSVSNQKSNYKRRQKIINIRISTFRLFAKS
jgi:hypothetical protein